MKTKVLKCLFAATLAVTLLFNLVIPVLGGEPAEDGTAYISIDKTYLKAGYVLQVSNPSDLDLEYFVGEEKIETDALLLTSDYYESWITVKGYDGDKVYEDRAYFSKLPVLYLTTDDGKPITTKKTYKTGTMFVQNNVETEKTAYSGAMQIKGRGNTSWGYPKKPYRIKLDKKADLFGMGSNKNWVLISSYIDECFQRNKTAYDMSRELGLEYMDSVWCDVVLNGEYAGNYLLCEQIRIDETRVNIFDWESEAKDVAKAIAKAEKKKGNILDADALEETMKSDLSWVTTGTVEFEGAFYATGKTYDDITGGYLFELSNEYDEVSKFMTSNGLKVMLKSPEYLNTNQEMMEYVQTLWENFEGAIRSEDGYVETVSGERIHYTEFADLDSMVSYWLVMEIMGNNDAVYKSRYAYLDKDSLLKFGPAWDFDWGCGSSVVAYTSVGWKVTQRSNDQCFFKELTDDPMFIAKATEKYWEIRPYLESLICDGGILDIETDYLLESGHADEARWDRKVTWPETARGFENDAEMFKQYLTDRIAWLDAQFESDKKLISSTRSSSNSFPYKKSDDKISFDFSNVSADTLSANAPADALIDYGRDTDVNVQIKDANTVTLDVYINGLYHDSFEVESGAVSFAIESDSLTEEPGKKNVVSVVGKDQNGTSTYKNFYTLIKKKQPEIVPGDVNGDNRINSKDISQMKKYIAGLVEDDAIVFCNADLNGDGRVNSKDVSAIKRLIAEG